MRIFLFTSLLIILFSSCAFNKLFLHPYGLSNEESFSRYDSDIKDTLTISFDQNRRTLLTTSKDSSAQLGYNLSSVTFPNTNGDSLYAWFFKPTENYNGTTIYFLHGNEAHLVYHLNLVTPFVKRGYQVFVLDYSGFGFSQGASTRKNVLVDGNSGLNYLLARKDIEHDKVLIYGQSLGGHLAASIAAENQDKIDGLIIEGAFSSHKSISHDLVPVLGWLFTTEMYSAKKNIQYFKKPTLVIHSTEDEVVPYDHGEILYKNAGGPKAFLSIEKDHIRGPIYYADSIISNMDRLFK